LVAGHAFLEALGVFESGAGIVNGAGTHHYEEAVIFAVEDGLGSLHGRRDERVDAGDAEVVCIGGSHGAVLKIFLGIQEWRFVREDYSGQVLF